MEIVSKSRRVTNTSFDLVFIYADEAGAGFSFPCTESGEVLPLPIEAVENYRKCLSGEHNVLAPEVRKSEHSYTEFAVGKCVCGRKVILSSFTNTCDRCERDYNMSGQLLTPRHQWGEETGEHWSECF